MFDAYIRILFPIPNRKLQ